MKKETSHQILRSPDFDEVIWLLESVSLPTADISPNQMSNFIQLHIGGQLAGIGGLEMLDGVALLRSLVCVPDYRGLGVGKALVRELERLAMDKGIKSLYLLTNTAETFFEKLGYQAVAREDVPEAIKNTREFTELCPDSAIVMVSA